MTQVCFDIPQADIQDYIDHYGNDYDDQKARGFIDPNMTKAQYAKQRAAEHLANPINRARAEAAASAASKITIT